MSNSESEKQATILEIQRLSTEDGPGIRTTVFFKGCTLKCVWCHNPESISPKPQIHWIQNRCIGCDSCMEVCPEGALSRSAVGVKFDRNACTGCGTCAEECPAAAIELLGRSWSVKELLTELIKDKAYFGTSGGGVTIGGGEPLMQFAFASDLLKELHQQGIHTAVDTCGHSSPEAYRALLPHTDLILFDIKLIDSEEHARFTGAGNSNILANLRMIGQELRTGDNPQELWIRTPVIPDATDTEDNIRGIGRMIAASLNGCVRRWELLAFNKLCKDKYMRLDQQWHFESKALPTKARMEQLAQAARESGVEPSIVHWSGSTRLSKD